MHWPVHRHACPRRADAAAPAPVRRRVCTRVALFTVLPWRLTRHIFEWLDARALARVLASCKCVVDAPAGDWEQSLWRRLCLQFWPQALGEIRAPSGCGWRDQYRRHATSMPCGPAGPSGSSARTIWAHLVQAELRRYCSCRPFDADDFGRCYRLLRARPDWRARLWCLQHVSAEWYSLVREWPRLEVEYEREFLGLAAQRTLEGVSGPPFHSDLPAWRSFLRPLVGHWPPPAKR